MGCPKCNSPNVRIAEPGFFKNDMLCMNPKCQSTFQRYAPGIKAAGVHGVMMALPTIFFSLMSDGDFDI